MTRFWWVRHGPTHARAMVGWSDLPADLSDLAALERLAGYLPADAAVVASDLGRASATADAIQAGRTRLPDERGLREMNFGRWELKGFSEISREDPDLSRAFWERPGELCAPGGESWNDMTERVEPVVARLAAHHSGRDVIVVAHFGVILGQLALALGKPPAGVLGQRIENLSVTRIDIAATGRSAPIVNFLA